MRSSHSEVGLPVVGGQSFHQFKWIEFVDRLSFKRFSLY